MELSGNCTPDRWKKSGRNRGVFEKNLGISCGPKPVGIDFTIVTYDIYILYRYVCRIYLSSAIRRYETEMEHDALHGKIWPETADVAVSSGSG